MEKLWDCFVWMMGGFFLNVVDVRFS